MEATFKCNILSCSVRVCQQLCFSLCGHIFCVSHGREWFAVHDTCPVCDEKTEVRAADFSRTRETALVGCSPEAMMRAVAAGMRFWEQQRALERQQTEEREKAGLSFFQEKLLQAEDVIKDLMGALQDAKGRRATEALTTPETFDLPANAKRSQLSALTSN